MKRMFVATQIEKVQRHLVLAEEGLAALNRKLHTGPRRATALGDVTAAKRDCPFCGKRIMANAVRCGYCWKKMPESPPPARAETATP